MFCKRSDELELIDLGTYSQTEYEHCLKTLDRVGRWLGGDAGTFAALDRMQTEPQSILDVGCGGGIFTTKLARKYPKAKIVGIDLNPDAIAFAKKQINLPSNVTFECKDNGLLEGYDVVLSTLVCHHLSDEAIVEFIKQAAHAAKKRVIFNDLHRNILAYYLFKIVSPIFFRNRLVQHDGPLSVLRSFKRKEWKNYLERAGIKPSASKIRWHWAFRWVVEIDCERGEHD